MTKRRHLIPTRSARARVVRLREKLIDDLNAKVVKLEKELHDEIVRNATPTLSMTAQPGHQLVVHCEGFMMRVRTRAVNISTTKIA